jgi:AcrR family transcriptional regulator
MDERRDFIVEQAHRLFMQYGLRGVTMEDLAREMGVSKKTLYVHFTDKNSLVEAAVASFLSQHQAAAEAIFQTSPNPIDQLWGIAGAIQSQLQQVKPSVYLELRKYFPSAYKLFENYQQQSIRKQVVANLIGGIEAGWYRASLNPEILSRLFIQLMPMKMDLLIFQPDRFDFNTLHREMLMYHMHGICSSKGLEYLTQHYASEFPNL